MSWRTSLAARIRNRGKENLSALGLDDRKFTVASYWVFLWKYRFTTAGRWFVAGLLLSVMFGSASVDVPIYHVFSALTVFFFADRLVGYAMRPHLSVEQSLSLQTTAGEPLAVELTVTNQGRRTAYDLAAGFFALPKGIITIESEQPLGDLPAGESLSTTVTLRADRRGIYSLPRPRCFSTFPFQMFRDSHCLSESPKLLAMPAFEPIARFDLPVGARYQPGGVALTSNIGESPEYIGNREYVAGDSIRRIDHRSWARIGRPIVREYQEEYYCRVALILDTFVPAKLKPTRLGFPNLEAAISLSAAIADALARGEYLIDLFAAGPELYVFRAGRHTAHFQNVLEIVAGVDACRENPFETIAPAVADELTNISTLVGVFLDWDDSRRELVRTAREHGCEVKVLVVKDGATSEPIDHEEGEIIQLGVDEVRRGGFETL